MTLDHNIYNYGAKGTKVKKAENKDNKPDVYIIGQDNNGLGIDEWLLGIRIKEVKGE